jgi:para-aminobenzoate synthetase component I
MTFENFVTQLDAWGKSKTPFFFLIDFEQKKPVAYALYNLPDDIKYDFNGKSNCSLTPSNSNIVLQATHIDEDEFKKKFEVVHKHLLLGNSYLANLTVRTQIKMNGSLAEVFAAANARYKLLYKEEFLVFSPETFIQVRDGSVFSYPMKGTIDASIKNAENLILQNKKEQAEHVTIVDLIRNDLSLIANDVKVTRFRYMDKIESNHKTLLQVSSEIQGQLNPNYKNSAFGSILKQLLPAGSISGAPKSRTVEIIQQAEGIERGYYTGVAGIFDGDVFDSGVLIRFIENDNGKFYYRSGGGITTASDWRSEYQEVNDKIYVPVT